MSGCKTSSPLLHSKRYEKQQINLNKIKKPCARSNYEDEGGGDVWLWFREKVGFQALGFPLFACNSFFMCDLMERGVAWGDPRMFKVKHSPWVQQIRKQSLQS